MRARVVTARFELLCGCLQNVFYIAGIRGVMQVVARHQRPQRQPDGVRAVGEGLGPLGEPCRPESGNVNSTRSSSSQVVQSSALLLGPGEEGHYEGQMAHQHVDARRSVLLSLRYECFRPALT